MTNKHSFAIFAAALSVATWLASVTMAQEAAPAAPAPAATVAAPAPAAAAPAPAPAEPSEPAFSQEQLDQMLAPIALYPDSLLMQILMAATYPLEIVSADRWRAKNPTLEGDALDKAAAAEDWDPSVKSLLLFPTVLGRMSENLDWTQDLGDAFLAQQTQVLDTIQALRRDAYAAGNLKSGEQQTVVVEKETQVIQIQPAQPQVVYVPQYNSAAVYGTPPPAAPYYPAANTYSGTDMLMTGALSFGAGLLIGNLIWDDDSDCDWDNHHVYGGYGGGNNDININGDVNIGNKTKIGGGNRQSWQHNPARRDGVRYRDEKTRQTFANKPGARPALDSGAARGYNRDTLGSGGGLGKGSSGGARPTAAKTLPGGASPKLGGGVGSKAPSAAKLPASGSRVASAPKKALPSSAGQKRPANEIGSAGGNRPTAIGGLGGGSATRAASTRGATSRGSSGAGSKLGGGGSKAGGAKAGGGRSGGGKGR